MVANKIGFFTMLHAFYAAFASLASMFQRFANAGDNLGKWAEEQTGVFVDEARIDREDKIDELMQRRLERQQAKLAAPQQVTDVQAKAPAKAKVKAVAAPADTTTV